MMVILKDMDRRSLKKEVIDMPKEHLPKQNHLLAAFTAGTQDRLYPHLLLEFLPLGKVLYESGHALHRVYFPVDSIISLLYVMESGLPATNLRHEFNSDADMRMLMLRNTQALITQMAQTAVCNRHHSIDEQLCRWLLLSMDRLPSNRLTMTQELIANMLGVRREGVSEAAGKLQKLGVITYRRGTITVLDRPKLEQLCCECYSVVKQETDRLQSYLP